MIIKYTTYCDIVVRIQIAMNVAIPACSLCINRRLYKIATTKAVMITSAEKRRGIIIDLLIGLGIPILQMVSQYIVQDFRYNLLEDFGPFPSIASMNLSIPLVFIWPIVVGAVAAYYCILSIYHFYRRRRQFSQVMSSNRGLNQSRYLRLMCLSGVEVLGTIPMGAWVLALNVRAGLAPWVSWHATHRTNSEIPQIPAIVWKSDHISHTLFEFNRWLLVACAFSFFIFFGFADEARRHYRLVYTSLASRVGLSTSNGKLTGSSHATSSFPHMGSKGGVTVSVMTVSGGYKRDSTVSIDQLSIPSISIGSDLKPDFKIEQHSPSDYTTSSSVSSFDAELYEPSSGFITTSLTPPPATVPPALPGTVEPTIRPAAPTYVIDTAHAV